MKKKVIENKKASLKNNYIYNFISQILTLVIPLITTPYLARIFHESGNGQIAFAETIVSYFLIFANFGFAIYGQREIAKKQNDIEGRSKVFFEITYLRITFTIASFLILLLTNSLDAFGQQYQNLIFIYGLQVLAVAFDFNFLLQGMEDFKTIALRTIVLRLILLACVFLFVKTENDMWIYALIFCSSIILSNLLICFKASRYISLVKFKELEFKKHLIPSLIIFLPTLSATIYSSLDKIMIRYLAPNPDYDNGCYSQALKINQVVLILVIVIESIMVARNSRLYSEGKVEEFKNNIRLSENYVFHIGIPLLCGMCITAYNVSSWFLGDGYDEVPILLCIMSTRFLTSGLATVYGNQLLLPISKEKYITYAHLGTGLCNLILNFIFIPWLGAIGGAITTAIAEGVDFLILLVIAYKFKFIEFKSLFVNMIKPIIASSVMTICIYFINASLSFSVWSFLLVAASGGTIYLIILFLLKDKFIKLIFDKFFHPFIVKFKK